MPSIVEWIKNNAIIHYHGEVSFDDVLNVNNGFTGDSRFDRMDFMILNYLKIDKVLLTDEERKIINELIKTSMIWNPRLKVGFAIKDKELIDRTQKTLEYLGEQKWKFQIFEDQETAIEWCTEKDSGRSNEVVNA